MQEIREEIIRYWSKRADSYSDENNAELSGASAKAWLSELTSILPAGELKILDVGTGPGFLAILLRKAGYRVTGIDCTKEMLEQAERNACKYGLDIPFINCQADQLAFDDCSTDVIISRNLTWNLIDPEKTYREWYRVLKPQGKLIIFDANWYGYLFSPDLRKAYEADRENVRHACIHDHNIGFNFEQMEKIAEELPMTLKQRPQWDTGFLKGIGFRNISADEDVWDRVWTEEEKLNYASTPLFEIIAEK